MSKIILLRGLGREKQHWTDEFINMLIRRDYVPILLDLPGAGDYRQLNSPTEIADYVSFLQQKYDEIVDDNEKVYILGHSLGAMIAIRWAFEYPQNFKKLFLVNASDKRSRSITERIRVFGIWKLINIIRANNAPQEREKEILDMNSNNKVAQKTVLDKWIKLACNRSMKSISLLNQFYAASSFTAPSKLEVPAVYITSKGDRMVSYRCSEKLASQHRARICKHDRAGHDIALDDPEWVIDCIGTH